MINDKDLSKPVAFVADCGTIFSDGDPFFDDYKHPSPLYSQEYVQSLLGRISDLESQVDALYQKQQDESND